MGIVFPYSVAALNLGAALVYACQRNWRFALLWACYTITTVLIAGAR